MTGTRNMVRRCMAAAVVLLMPFDAGAAIYEVALTPIHLDSSVLSIPDSVTAWNLLGGNLVLDSLSYEVEIVTRAGLVGRDLSAGFRWVDSNRDGRDDVRELDRLNTVFFLEDTRGEVLGLNRAADRMFVSVGNGTGESVQLGDKVPAFERTALDSSLFEWDDMKGKFVLLTTWGTWSDAYMAELPYLRAARSGFSVEELAIVSIAADGEPDLRAFLGENHLPWVHIREPLPEAALFDLFPVWSGHYLIGPGGILYETNLRGEYLLQKLNAYLNRGPKILMAIANWNVKWIKNLIRDGADINVVDQSGSTPLILAAMRIELRELDQEVVQRDSSSLLGGFVEVDKENLDMDAAAAMGPRLEEIPSPAASEIVEALIGSGADVNAQNEYGRTALIEAASVGNVDVVRRLIDAGAGLQPADGYGRTALTMAACMNPNLALPPGPNERRRALVQLLLKAGAEPDASSQETQSALLVAAGQGDGPVVADLLEAGASPDRTDESGETALMHAARSGVTDVVELLIGSGLDVNAIDANEMTPLMHAAQHGRAAAIRALMDAGADIGAKTAGGTTVILNYSVLLEHPSTVLKALLEAGADPNTRDSDGGAPLILASYGPDTSRLEALLEFGADVNVQDRAGNTPLLNASNNGYADGVSFLLQAGAAVNAADTSGTTPLASAARNGHSDVVALLLRSGADRNVADKAGNTAMHGAVMGGHVGAVRALLEVGAGADAPNRDGKTALMLANDLGLTEIVDLLQDPDSP